MNSLPKFKLDDNIYNMFIGWIYTRTIAYQSVLIEIKDAIVAMFNGRTQREKDRFAEAITDDVVQLLGVKTKTSLLYFKMNPWKLVCIKCSPLSISIFDLQGV